MILLAIDPGPTQSAWCKYDTDTCMPIEWAKEANETMPYGVLGDDTDLLVTEMIASYGMSVGAEVFETVYWIGRFAAFWDLAHGHDSVRLFRRDVKLHLCGNSRAKDSNIRQALVDRYGPGKEKAIGLKKSPGPLYGFAGDGWAALAVAVTYADTRLDLAVAA